MTAVSCRIQGSVDTVYLNGQPGNDDAETIIEITCERVKCGKDTDFRLVPADHRQKVEVRRTGHLYDISAGDYITIDLASAKSHNFVMDPSDVN